MYIYIYIHIHVIHFSRIRSCGSTTSSSWKCRRWNTAQWMEAHRGQTPERIHRESDGGHQPWYQRCACQQGLPDGICGMGLCGRPHAPKQGHCASSTAWPRCWPTPTTGQRVPILRLMFIFWIIKCIWSYPSRQPTRIGATCVLFGPTETGFAPVIFGSVKLWCRANIPLHCRSGILLSQGRATFPTMVVATSPTSKKPANGWEASQWQRQSSLDCWDTRDCVYHQMLANNHQSITYPKRGIFWQK